VAPNIYIFRITYLLGLHALRVSVLAILNIKFISMGRKNRV